jgi:cell division septum initiation protein DivIVA
MVNTNMKNMKLPEEIQTEIREFMFTTQNSLDNQKEMNQFVDMLSPSLKNLVMQHIFINAFKRN